MVTDLLAETRRRIAAARPASAAAVRHMAAPLVAFSEEMRQNDRALRTFLFARMYRHYKVNRMTSKARGVVRSEEHTSELQSLMRISYAVFCLKKKTNKRRNEDTQKSHLLQSKTYTK